MGMNKSRTLSVSAAWLAPQTADTAECVRGPDEQVSLYYREHAESLYRYLTGYFGCEEDAEEIMQEAFLRLYEELDAGVRIEKPEAWVFTVARRLMFDRLKQTRHDEAKYREFGHLVAQLIHEFPAPDEVLLEHLRMESLRMAWKELDRREKQFLFARAKGMKLRQIGEKTGMDVRRVSEIITRAIRTLQRLCE
jgi:RNA polymerase sigma factor (sigma-70 family)